MAYKWLRSIFKKGSTTYFYSSLFFPKEALVDVTKLYSYVRTADNFVDCIPQNQAGLIGFTEQTAKAFNGEPVDEEVIDAFVDVSKKYQFDPSWGASFLGAMHADMHKTKYETLEELEEYMYGSAEVIGLMMAKVMSVPELHYDSARLLGKSMQYINFLRDVQEDLTLGRQYIPQEILDAYGLPSLREDVVRKNPEVFKQMYRAEIDRFLDWDNQARLGLGAIPRKYRIAVATASDMYRWTALQLKKDPFLVYEKKCKPSKYRVVSDGLKNYLTA